MATFPVFDMARRRGRFWTFVRMLRDGRSDLTYRSYDLLSSYRDMSGPYKALKYLGYYPMNIHNAILHLQREYSERFGNTISENLITLRAYEFMVWNQIKDGENTTLPPFRNSSVIKRLLAQNREWVSPLRG